MNSYFCCHTGFFPSLHPNPDDLISEAARKWELKLGGAPALLSETPPPFPEKVGKLVEVERRAGLIVGTFQPFLQLDPAAALQIRAKVKRRRRTNRD